MNEYIGVVIKEVCSIWGVTSNQIKGTERNKAAVYARRFVYALVKERYNKISLTGLGKILNKTHATVIFSLSQHEIDLELVNRYRDRFKSCERKLSGFQNSNKYDTIRSLKKAYGERIALEKKIDTLEVRIKQFDRDN